MFAVVTTLTTLMVALDSGSPFLVSLAILFGSALLMIAGWKREKEYSRVEHLIRHLSPRTHEQEYSLDKLESQIEGLLWEVERLSQGIGVKGQHSSKNADETPHTFEEVVTQQMTTLHERFRSVSSVFCYESEGDISFVRMGIGGTRFESRLQALLVSFFRTGVLDCEGLVDGERSSLQTDLSLFGIRFGIAYPVFWQEQGEEKRGVLWLGYRAEKPPLEVEVSRCRTGASELGEYLTNMLRVSKLSARASHAEETLEQREDYIAHISHDIRTPLNNIQSILRLLSTEEENPSQRELLETALGNCLSLHDIVDGVVEYSRHKAGKLAARPETFFLHELVEEIVQTFRVSARLRGLDLYFTCKGGLTAFADRRQIRRVVTNLVSNAIKYTSYGSITVSCSASEANELMVTVSDTGVGLSEDQIERLFIPFSRFQEKNTEGAGLGLTLSKILIELNGGTITCTSKPGHGSLFSVSLPSAIPGANENLGFSFESRYPPEGQCSPIPGINQNQNDLEGCAHSGSLISARDMSESLGQERESGYGSNVLLLPTIEEEIIPISRNASILVIDDDADSVDSLARTLHAYGFEVFTAITERDALSICNYETPDFVISDFHMPQGGARTVLPKLALLESAPCVVVLSGSGDGNIQEEAKALGAHYVFSKPVDVDTLVTLFDALLEEREERFLLANS